MIFLNFVLVHFLKKINKYRLQKTFQWPFQFYDFRRQKEEALNFRAKKENEVIAVEKVRIQAHM